MMTKYNHSHQVSISIKTWWQVVCGTMGLPTATVRMRGPDGISRTTTGMGAGPVDAAYKAIDSLVRVQVRRDAPSRHWPELLGMT